MASIGNDPGGRRRILFVAGDGTRKTIRLGKVSQRQAEAFKVKLEALIGQGITGAVDDEVSRWLVDLPDTMHARLAGVGLVKRRDRAAATIGTFLADYFADLTVKPGTAIAYGHTRRCLKEYFGEAKPLRDIEPADADKYRQWLKAQGLADATVNKRVSMGRMLFRRALRWKLVAENPFEGVKAGGLTNKARQFYVTREMADKVLKACPDIQWRLLFALSRYGGLRCPSEHMALRWGDVDFEHGRIRVPSPKTEHHAGKDCRTIPMFPELRPVLLEAFEAAEPGTEYVITHYRDARQNLRTQLTRIITRAGLTVWPKLFHNLRATRQTELAERYPLHVVCAWIGNTKAVAEGHYLQVTDEHFSSAAQNQAQSAHVSAASGNAPDSGANEIRPENVADAALCGSVQESGMGALGFEPRTKGL